MFDLQRDYTPVSAEGRGEALAAHGRAPV